MDRRVFLRRLGGLALAGTVATGGSIWFSLGGRPNSKGHSDNPDHSVRPPGAVEESLFLSRCIGCFQCAEVCPPRAIKFINTLGGIMANTPLIVPHEKACILCMKCTHICPTGALREIKGDYAVIQREVKMGFAKVNESTCYAFKKEGICGACYYVCPFYDRAIVVEGPYFRPRIIKERCVGCGLCEEICPQETKSIRVRPAVT